MLLPAPQVASAVAMNVPPALLDSSMPIGTLLSLPNASAAPWGALSVNFLIQGSGLNAQAVLLVGNMMLLGKFVSNVRPDA